MAASEIAVIRSPHRVVVGVDGSTPSLLALQWALDYASATNSDVDVVVAWEWPTSVVWSAPFPSDFDPGMSAQQMLDGLIEHERGTPGSGHRRSGRRRRPRDRLGIGIRWCRSARGRPKGTRGAGRSSLGLGQRALRHPCALSGPRLPKRSAKRQP